MFQILLLTKKFNVNYPGQMVITNTSQPEMLGDRQHAGGKGVGCGL